MPTIYYTSYGYYIEIGDKTIVKKCSGTKEEKRVLAEKDIANYVPTQTPTPEPTQLDRIEETISSTALTTEYMACLQEINSETVQEVKKYDLCVM